MKQLIIANWKMNPQTLAEAKRLFDSIKRGLKNIKNVEVVICPPFVYLARLQPSTPNLRLGAQNCFWEDYNPPTTLPLKRAPKGAFTGEISPLMLKNLGCQYVILGHSERERYLGETDEMTNKKIKAAISAKLNPILCIGEIEKEKKRGEIPLVLKHQLEKTLINLSPNQLINLIIAYEPVWAIGTGKPCYPQDAGKRISIIRKIISNLYNLSFSQKIKIIYGGSVNSKIAQDYVKKANFQGLLVGGASLKTQEFIEIAKKVSQT
jgi:triosephosphate isomerase